MKKFQKHSKDTASASVQIALLTERIKDLTMHFKKNKKDLHSMRGLITFVNKRKKLTSYMKRKSFSDYQKLIQELGLRK